MKHQYLCKQNRTFPPEKGIMHTIGTNYISQLTSAPNNGSTLYYIYPNIAYNDQGIKLTTTKLFI